MSSRPRFLVLMMMALIVVPPAVGAEKAAEGQDGFLKAAVGIVDWLKNVTSALGPFVSSEEKDQFIRRLEDLHDRLGAVRDAKLNLLYELKVYAGSPQQRANYQEAAADLVKRVRALQSALNRVSSKLAGDQKAQGAACERLLSDTVNERKQWLNELPSAAVIQESGRREELIARGDRSIEALGEAKREVAKVISRLRG